MSSQRAMDDSAGVVALAAELGLKGFAGGAAPRPPLAPSADTLELVRRAGLSGFACDDDDRQPQPFTPERQHQQRRDTAPEACVASGAAAPPSTVKPYARLTIIGTAGTQALAEWQQRKGGINALRPDARHLRSETTAAGSKHLFFRVDDTTAQQRLSTCVGDLNGTYLRFSMVSRNKFEALAGTSASEPPPIPERLLNALIG